MNILALDTSSKAASCAFLSDGLLIGEFFTNASLTHSQTIMPMVCSLLDNTRRSLSEVDLFAVSCGPGSFTGLRIGIGAVKGMAMATGKPCAAVSTLWGLALNMEGYPGYVLPVMDARCNQVYTALFHDGKRVWEDMAISLDELDARLLELRAPITLVGDGARLCAENLSDVPDLTLAPEPRLHQRASSLCTPALELLEKDMLTTASELAPFYLRLPQAEREFLQKQVKE